MKLNQHGAVSGVTIGLIVAVVLLIGSIVFGVLSFKSQVKYKNHADQLISTAVAAAKLEQQTTDAKAFFIKAQLPLVEYVGPSAYGTINLYYPKNWSAYVDSTGETGYPINGYFDPAVLPSVVDNGTVNYALRMQVENETYTQVLEFFNNEQQSKEATVTAYSLPKLPNVVGVEVVGQLSNNVKGTLVILPLRTEALEVWTEGTAYLPEFNSDILANLSFSP